MYLPGGTDMHLPGGTDMHLRNVTTAFLMNRDDFLMMKRSEHKKIAPGYWYGVGGHLEPAELNDPRGACLREIEEETGLDAAQVLDLRLRYIVMRRSGTELVINYFYFGRTATRELKASDEGTLHWIPRGEALDRKLFPAIGLTLGHFLEEGDMAEGSRADGVPGADESADQVQVGLVALADGQPVILWNSVMDWNDPA